MVTRNEESEMPTIEVTKQAWVDEYASRILQVWYKWPSPFGLDKQYSKEVKTESSRNIAPYSYLPARQPNNPHPLTSTPAGFDPNKPGFHYAQEEDGQRVLIDYLPLAVYHIVSQWTLVRTR
jgi:hypothetical protein